MSARRKSAFGAVARAEPLHLKVASLIQREIDRGRLKPGDQLPTEHELAAQFSVSRNVVREAIACLRSDGVLDSRQGVGAFVLPPEGRLSIRIDSASLRESPKIRGLFELRATLEIESAGLAASRRTEEQLNDIARALDKMTGADKWSDIGIDADLEFHRRVAMATGNDYMVTFLSFISQTMRETILEARISNELEEVVEATIAEHAPIYEAIAKSDVAASRRAMQRHIRGAARRLGVEL